MADEKNKKSKKKINNKDILIIYGHPNFEGHCHEILKEVKYQLDKKELNSKILHLYNIEYNPVLQNNEFYIIKGNNFITETNEEIQKKIKKCKLIFIYPIWWSSMPAILKGFFDRVFTPGFAFKFEGKLPKKLLKNTKALVITTSGAPKPYHVLKGNIAKKLIKNEILKYSGIKTKYFQIGNARKLDNQKKKQINKIVKKGLNWFL